MSRLLDPRLVKAVPSVLRLLVALAVLQVLAASATIAQAVAVAGAVAGVVVHGVPVTPSLMLLAAAVVVRSMTVAGQEWLVGRASGQLRTDLRRGVLAAVDRLGPQWASAQPAGRLVNAVGAGLEGLDGWVTRALPSTVSAVVVPVMALAAIIWADWRSAVVLVLVLPLVPLFMVLVGVSTRRRMEQRYAALGRLAGHFLDLVQGLTTLKVYGQVRRQVDTVRAATDAYRLQTLATLRLAFLSGLVLDLIATLSVAVVAVSVGLRLDAGHLGLRRALLTLLLTPEVFAPLRAMGAQHHAAEEGQVATSAALDILDDVHALPLPPPLSGVLLSDGSLTVRHLTVGYPRRSELALSDVSFAVGAGELVAVQGRSGGGKSTLLAVLLGLVEPTAGTITVGSQGGNADLATVSLHAWRANVAWVPQRPAPTQATVGDEVRLGDPSATPDTVARVVAVCHGPHPQTPLGEQGAGVSAGQRRRVSLARAVLRAEAVRAAGGVPLVLLDEPSEDLDEETQAVVAAVIASLAGWATVLIVTHSDELARVAGRRLALSHGRLVGDTRYVPQHRDARAPYASTVPSPPHVPPPVAPSWRPLLADLHVVRRRLAGAAALAGAAGLAGLALTTTSVWMICRAAQHPNLQTLAVAVVGVRTFALSRALLRYAERLASHDVALRVLAELRVRVFAALEPLAPAGLAAFRRGDLLRRFLADVDGVQEGLVRAVVPLAGALVTTTGATVLACLIDPTAGTVLALGLVCGMVVAPWVAVRVAGSGASAAAAAGSRDAQATAFLEGLAELTVYGATGTALAGIGRAEADVRTGARRAATGAAASTAISSIAAGVTLVLVLLAGSSAARTGRMSAVEIGVLLAAVLGGFDALSSLPTGFAAWSRCRAGLTRVSALLATPAPVAEPSSLPAVPSGPLTWVAAEAQVAPSSTAPAILSGVSFTVGHGERVAIVGPSGCGKSTLLAAAMRLLPTREGRLDLVGTDGVATSLLALGSAAMPALVAGSLQGDHVFDTSLRENLLVVRPEATDVDLDAVAARAGLTEFIDALPLRWSTPAGVDGAALSGGQRQRVLLARALLAAPAILLLDEPTAHLDEATARAVMADLLDSTRGLTVLFSSHRELPTDAIDRVLQVHDGGVGTLVTRKANQFLYPPGHPQTTLEPSAR